MLQITFAAAAVVVVAVLQPLQQSSHFLEQEILVVFAFQQRLHLQEKPSFVELQLLFERLQWDAQQQFGLLMLTEQLAKCSAAYSGHHQQFQPSVQWGSAVQSSDYESSAIVCPVVVSLVFEQWLAPATSVP